MSISGGCALRPVNQFKNVFMRSLLKTLLPILLMVTSFSCDNEQESIAANLGHVSFFVNANAEHSEGRTNGDDTPTAIVLSLQDKGGSVVYQNKKLALLQFGGGFITESLVLQTGQVKLTGFIVLNASNHVIYASPLTGSDKADELERPLPLIFQVSKEMPVRVVPQVLQVTQQDTPEIFGYASFGFDIVDDPATMKVKVKVQLTVGEIDYLNVDTKVVVKGFDADNQEKWSQDFLYQGPEDNSLLVKSGLDHYTFEINHWGINDKQIIKGTHLYEGRAEGPAPVTYVMGGSIAAKKVSHYITYMEMNDPTNPGTTYMAPQQKVSYAYNAFGKPEKMTVYGYSAETNSFTEDRYFLFTYSGNRVVKLAGYHAATHEHYIEDHYEYLTNGNVSKISEQNYGAGTETEVTFTYNYTDRVIYASYSLSNGQGFTYEVFYDHKNIETDRTSRSGSLCSRGEYAYDKNINPMKHLGYVDFLLRNYSINNRMTEDVQYLACAFPTLIPERYGYVYDADGYPTEATTYYASNTGIWEAKTQYFYQ
jgi:hypothetical protein